MVILSFLWTAAIVGILEGFALGIPGFALGGFVLLLGLIWWHQVGRFGLDPCRAASHRLHRAEERRQAFNRLLERSSDSNGSVVPFPGQTSPAIQAHARRRAAECEVLLTALRDAGHRGLTIPEIYELGIENPRARLLQLRERGHVVEPERSTVPERQVLVHEVEQEAHIG